MPYIAYYDVCFAIPHNSHSMGQLTGFAWHQAQMSRRFLTIKTKYIGLYNVEYPWHQANLTTSWCQAEPDVLVPLYWWQ